MLKIAHLLERLCTYAARFAGILLLALTAVVLYDVIGRQFFNTGSVGLSELQWHIHGAIALMAFGYAYTRNAHVRIDVFSSGFTSRFKARLEIAGIALCLTPFLLVVVWYGYDFAERSFSRGERSPVSLGLSHRWIIKSVVPLSAIFALMGAWSVLLRMVVHLRGDLDEPFVHEGLWRS